MSVAILLSTYNGEKYLHEQLDSIFDQTYAGFKLVVRDDGSKDNTVAILEEYQKMHPTRMEIVVDNLGNLGVAKSFRYLMEQSNADYYLFADQDDIWELNKIEVLMQIASMQSNFKIPFLLFSDILVFNNSNKLAYSFFKKVKVSSSKIKNGLFQGTIPGCAILFNDACKKKNLQSDVHLNILHDHSLFLTAYVFGDIQLTNKKLIQHRIHNSNVVGENSKKSKLTSLKDFLKYIFKSKLYRRIVLNYYFDYIDFQQSSIPSEIRISKELFLEKEIDEMTYFQRKKWYLKHFNPFLYGKVNGLLITLTI